MLDANVGCGEEVGESSWSTAEWLLLSVLLLTAGMSIHIGMSVDLLSELQMTMLMTANN